MLKKILLGITIALISSYFIYGETYINEILNDIKEFTYTSAIPYLNGVLQQLLLLLPVVLVLVTITFFYYPFVSKKRLYNQVIRETDTKIVDNFAGLYNLYIFGDIGSGKTSTGSYIANILADDKKYKASNDLYSIREKLLHMNMREIDKYIQENYHAEKYYSNDNLEYFVKEMVQEINPDNYDELFNQTIYRKFIIGNKIPILRALCEYVELFYIVNLRDTNIYSNIPLYSASTGQYSVIVKETYTQYKRDTDIPIEKHIITFQDEDGVNNNSRERSGFNGGKGTREKFDDGKDIRKMLLRHPSQGTETDITIGQVNEDVAGPLKRLGQVFLYMKEQGRHKVLVYRQEINLINSLIARLKSMEQKKYSSKMDHAEKLISGDSLLEFIPLPIHGALVRKGQKIKSQYFDYIDKDNNYKKYVRKLSNLRESLEEYEILVNKGEVHHSYSTIGTDVDKDTINAYKLTFKLPAKIVFSSYDSYVYGYAIKEKRNENSKQSMHGSRKWQDVKPTKEELEYSGYAAINRVVYGDDTHDDNEDSGQGLHGANGQIKKTGESETTDKVVKFCY